MKIISLKERLQSGYIVSGVYLMMAFSVMSLFLNGCEKELAVTSDTHQTRVSYPEGSAEKFEKQPEITILLPNLPNDAKKLEMLLIKPGSFTMGQSNAEKGRRSWERPWSPHKVAITKPFYMGKYEVTQAQWET